LAHKLTVKERAQLYTHVSLAHDHRHSKLKPKSEKDSSDTDSIASVTLSEKEKNWLILAAKCDYHRMMKALQAAPDLAPYADFFARLHGASLRGEKWKIGNY